MYRVQQVWDNRLRILKQAEIDEEEKTRRFCRHDLAHLLDVARIAYIMALEEGLDPESSLLSKDLIYACALLHDIGRADQYKNGQDHDEAGVEIAKRILKETDFNEEEEFAILTAIAGHRRAGYSDQVTGKEAGSQLGVDRLDKTGLAEQAEESKARQAADFLSRIIQQADHASRNCFACDAAEACYWPENKKNKKIKI